LGVRERIVSAAYSGVLAEDLLRTARFVPSRDDASHEGFERGFIEGMMRGGTQAADGALGDLHLCAALAPMGPPSMRAWGGFCEERRNRLIRYLGLDHPDEPMCAAAEDPTRGDPAQALVVLAPSFGVPVESSTFEPVRDAVFAMHSRAPETPLVP